MPSTYLALLRGINVGGRTSLPMAELVRLCEAAGCTGVQTYIQSGNVLFNAEPAVAAALPGLLPFPTLIRTATELDAVIAGNPYPPEHSHVTFLFAPAPPLPLPQPPEALTANGLHLYLYLPNGVGRSKLAAAMPKLGTTRNWRTVTKLRQLMAG
jgi:uncharacterized protein (DUF1697 family)